MIRLEHVSKTFDSRAGNVHAVQDVTLTIQDKEIYGIIGFSGAGKSTLVRCINLLERPSRGAVVIDDQDITKMKDKELRAMRKKIGMIFQHFNLMRSLSEYRISIKGKRIKQGGDGSENSQIAGAGGSQR